MNRSAPNLVGTLSDHRYTPSLKWKWYLARCPKTTAAQSRALVSGKAKNCTFLPPVKIRGGVDEISESLVVAAPMTKPLVHTFAGGPRSGCREPWSSKTKRRNSAVKLKAVPTNVGRLNKEYSRSKHCTSISWTNREQSECSRERMFQETKVLGIISIMWYRK